MIVGFIMGLPTFAFYVFYCLTIHKLTKTVNAITDSSSPAWWCSHVQFLGMPLKHCTEENKIDEMLLD